MTNLMCFQLIKTIKNSQPAAFTKPFLKDSLVFALFFTKAATCLEACLSPRDKSFASGKGILSLFTFLDHCRGNPNETARKVINLLHSGLP